MKRILLLVVVTCLFAGLPPVASAHHLPWQRLDRLVAANVKSSKVGLAKQYKPATVWGVSQRVITKRHFGEYRLHVFGYVYGTYGTDGTYCYVTCGLVSKFYFTCVSWVDFRYRNRDSRRVSVASIPGKCYSFWVDNLAVCGGGPCIVGFSPGDSVPPASVPYTPYEWTRSWRYWPKIDDPPF